jgi:alkylation response protein AidB-like acyl-CoA dehydrogenase
VQATGAAHFNEVFLQEVRIPVANVLGRIDEGWAPARTVLTNESAFIGGSGGSTYATLALLAREHGRTSDPLTRQGLADYYARERVLQFLGERILTAIRRRETPPVDPSILKLAATGNRERSGNVAMAIAGVAGLDGGHEQGRWIQSEVVGRYGISIGGGTSEVQRNNLAERALGLPREPSADKDKPWRDIPRS